jgi:hypothetical protein
MRLPASVLPEVRNRLTTVSPPDALELGPSGLFNDMSNA